MASKLPTDSSETSYSSITLENSSEQISDINDHLIPHPDLETTKTLPQSTNDANKSDQQTPNNRQILNSASAVNTTPLNLDIQSVESLLQSPDDSLSPIHEQTTPTLQYDQSPLTTDIETKSSTNKLYRRLSSVEEISPEQTNFLRLALLIFNDGVRALRYLFDRYIPPCQLKCTLLNKKHEMRKLLQKGTISKEQWGNLYLQNKPSSKHFDITLMLVLIRQLTGIPEPANGWNELPQVSDNSIEADIARLKWYRNKIAHTVRCSVNNQEFEQMWTAISKAVIHVAGSDHEEYFENKIKNLTTAVLDKTYYEVYKELINTINQDNTHYFQEDSLKRWENDDKTFVPTRATEMIKSLVERHDFVMVTGPPGSGKSASVHSVALQFGKQGYRVFPVSNTNAIKDYWKKDLKQMFVVDDAFGYHTLNKPRCNQWKSDFNDLKVCFSHSDMKIVLTVRTTYEREPVVIDLLEVIKPMRIQINDKDRDLTVAERRNIFKAHVTFNNRNDLLEMAEQIQNIEIYCFPLLCKLFAATKEPGLSPVDFFSKSVFKEEISKMKRNDRRKYFGLLICAMYDNNLDESVLDISNNNEKDEKLRKSFLELCCLPSGLSRKKILEQLNLLLGTYLIKEGQVYRFIHDMVHDAVISSIDQDISTEVFTMVLEHCSSKFVKNRIRLEDFHHHNDTHRPFIILPSQLETQWGCRMIRDLKDGNWYDVLSNEYIVSKEGDMILSKAIGGMEREYVESVMCQSQRKDREKYINFEQNTEFNVMKELTENLNKVQECKPLHWMILRGLKCVTTTVLRQLSEDKIHSLNSILNLLSLACISGDLELVETFTERVDLNQRDNFYGLSPLFVACMHGHSNIVNLLVRKGAGVNKRGAYGETPLYIASKFGFSDVVGILLDNHADVNISEKWNNKTPLYAASKYGHHEVVDLLTRNNADMYIADKDGKKPLFLASEAGHFKIVQTLIDNGIMVSSSKNDYKGATPLYVASAGGHYDIVKLLLENGADNNRRASFGETPLIASSRKGYEDIVKLLIEKDADVNRCNRRCSRTPLFVATSEGQIRIVKMLIDKGADIDKLTNSTPLCVSIEKGHVEIAELLIENHADVNKCENKHGKSPLYIASEKGNPQLVRLLVDNGANLNQPDKDHNETPLHVAARYGNREICEILVRKGADVNIKNDRGETVRSILHKFGWGNIENILKE